MQDLSRCSLQKTYYMYQRHHSVASKAVAYRTSTIANLAVWEMQAAILCKCELSEKAPVEESYF
eukprot:6718049-Karenia_brevis.AAC.1